MKISEIIFFKINPVIVIAICIILLAITGYFDYITGYEISLSVFYSFPIIITSWFVGIYTGLFFSFVCMFVIVYVDYLSKKYIDVSIIFLWNNSAVLGFYLFSTITISEIKRILIREIKSSRTDPLTQIANSRYFLEESRKEIERSIRYNHPLTCVFLDCDNFKNVNDTYGHSTGNELLKNIAKTISGCIRSTDIVARLGGDEFAILMPETGSELSFSAITSINNTLLKSMKEKNWDVTFSIGIATFIKLPNNVNEIIHESDKLMYLAKNNGKNSIAYKIFE